MNKVKGMGIKNPQHVTSIIEREERELLTEIGYRERLTISEITRKAVQEYIKSHAEGNSTFKLDKWNQDPNFQAIPTFKANRETWKHYYMESNQKDRTEMRIQLMDLQKLFRWIDTQ